MLIPKIGGSIFGIPDFSPGPEYRYAMGIGSALMAGWTVLLIWAGRKPVERKGVIPITIFPVITGMIGSGIYAVASGLIAPDKMIPCWISQGITFAFFLFTYICTRTLEEPDKTV
jgi:hypothetical protein